jgi:hypothetical protein
MSRIREEADAGHEIHDAVTRGLTRTGKVITSAGIILAGTFAALLIAPLPNLRQIGFGISVGILIDTFLVRSLIVPSATMLLGRWAFWPKIPHADGTAAPAIRRRHIGIAVAGIGALAAALTLLGTSGGSSAPIRVIAATAPPSTSTTLATPTTTAAPPSTDVPSKAVTDTTAAPSTTLAPASSVPVSGAAADSTIAAPTSGTWLYKSTGSKSLLGSGPQPINEDVTTTVSKTGSNIRVRSVSNTLTRDDTRRYSSTGVELLATTFNASGASFGGDLNPPQLLARAPLKAGDTWSGSSTAGGVTLKGTGRVLGPRDVTTPAGSFRCWDIQLDATITGSNLQGEQHETACWVPELGLPVVSTQTMTGTYSGLPFQLSIAVTLNKAAG